MKIKYLVAGPMGYKVIDCSKMSIQDIDKTYQAYNKSKYFHIERIEL